MKKCLNRNKSKNRGVTIVYRLIESKALSNFKNGTNESIALKEYVEINGVQQGMIIEGENIQNPV